MSLFGKEKGEGERKSPRKLQLLLILASGALGILFLLIGDGWTDHSKSENNSLSYSVKTDEVLLYREYMEKEVRDICENISGVGKAEVILSLSGGYESVYAAEETDGIDTYVILGSGANAKALLLRTDSPEICGIGVVCQGGGNPDVKKEVVNLLSAAFHLPTNRIYVTEAKSGGT